MTDDRAAARGAGPAAPRRFGKYELLERIGAGGMAEIYRAIVAGPDGFEKQLVLKTILPEHSQNRAFISMLIGEAKVTSLLQHPNVVQIFELGEVAGQYYIAMEYVEGSDLLNVLARCTTDKLRVPTETALYIVSEVCKGLAHAHAACDSRGRPLNIIHRDVSPSNILLSLGGDVKIMDFGVASADLGRPDAPASAGSVKGKIGYLSPEQVLGHPIDRRSDVFALGVILFECLTLKRLFVGKTDTQTLLNIRETNIERKFKRHSYIPQPIRDILRTALAHDPRDRYQTATDLQEAVLDYLFDNRLRVSARSLSTFLRAVLRTADPAAAPGAATAPAPEPRRPPPSTGPAPPLPPSLPELPAEGAERPRLSRELRRVDLTNATFHFRHDDGGTFGPVEYARAAILLRSRCIGPREWVAINGSDWMRACEVPVLVAIAPEVFEDEAGRPLRDGPLSRSAIPRLFHHLRVAGLDGKLKLTRGSVQKEIYFDRGQPLLVQSNLKDELLGAYLIARGLATPDDVDAALVRSADPRIPLGLALVDAGVLTTDALAAALHDQHRARIMEVFTWETGWYEFFGGLMAPSHVDLTPVSVSGLIADGIRAHYDLPLLRQLFSDHLDRPIVATHDAIDRADDVALTDVERDLGRAIASFGTLRELVVGAELNEPQELAVLRTAFALHQTDHLAFRGRAVEPR